MVGGEHSRKEPFEQLVNSYSEHLHMSPRQDNIFFGLVEAKHCKIVLEMSSTESYTLVEFASFDINTLKGPSDQFTL